MKYLAGIYKRVSTEERAQIIEGSLDSQEHRLKQFVDFKNVSQPGWGNVVDVYSDEGLSAKDTKRPAFQRMMRDIRKGRINLILVTDLSRLSRNILDFCLLLEELRKYNAKFLSLKEQFDTSTPAGEMMVFNMINLAQFERKQTAERVSLNFHSRAMRGLRNGGALLLGYKADPENKSRLVVDEEEADTVRKVFKLFLSEGTVGKLLKVLERDNIKPKVHTGRAYNRTNNGTWTRSTLYKMLRNPAYVGIREINKKHEGKDPDHLQPYQRFQKVKATWTPIVDDITFGRVQKALDEIQKLERERLANAHERPYIATGLLFCKDCGRPLMGASASGANEVHRYYGHRHIEGQKVTCRVKRHRADAIEETIVKHMLVTLRDEAHLNTVIEKVKTTDQWETQQHKRDRSKLEGEIANIDRDINFMIRETRETSDLETARMYREKIQSFSQMKTQKAHELALLLEKIAEAEDVSDSAESLREALEEIQAGFKKASSSVKKRLLRRMLMRVDVTPTTLELYYRSAATSGAKRLTLKTKTAPEHRSGAIVLSPDFASHDNLGDRKVVCSSIDENGRENTKAFESAQLIDYVNINFSEIGRSSKKLAVLRVEKQLSMRELSKATGHSRSHLRGQLRKFGIKAEKDRAGHAPFGWDWNGNELVPNAKETPVLCEILALRRSGKGCKSIASELNRRSIPSKTGGQWGHSSVQNILNREGAGRQEKAQ